MKLQVFYSSYFHGKNYFGDDGFQNMFVYQVTFNTLELIKDKSTDYVIGWKSKVLFESKLLPLHGAFLPNIKYFYYKIGMQFSNTPLVVEQNNYATKIVNAYIVYDLDNWTKIPFRNVTSKNCLFGATNIAKNSDKSKWMYSGYGIAFDGKGEYKFGNDYVKNYSLKKIEHTGLLISS